VGGGAAGGVGGGEEESVTSEPSPTFLRRLSIAEEICSFASSLAVQGNVHRREQRLTLTRRDRVLIGLALKIESSFRALIDDCRRMRSEAMHHLKTMAECMICFYAVLHDATETRARQVLAKALHEEALFIRENPSEFDPSDAVELETLRDELLAGGVKRLPRIEVLAKNLGSELGSWYSRVYRMACEPAHIGDVLEFMPEGDEPIVVGSLAGLAEQRARDALWYGGHIALAVMRSICEQAGLQAPVDELERRFSASDDTTRRETTSA
jgi:hypothetical protein